MKTKEQILDWLNKQPWKGEFYEASFFDHEVPITYDEHFICGAFDWSATKLGTDVWAKRDVDFRHWYDSNDKPMSWDEYCKQNPIKKSERFISTQCGILDLSERPRNEYFDVNVMSEDLCKAFLAYMKLIQLRNAWVKDCGDKDCEHRIIYSPTKGFSWVILQNGISFYSSEMVDKFINTFKDLLEVAKPLI